MQAILIAAAAVIVLIGLMILLALRYLREDDELQRTPLEEEPHRPQWSYTAAAATAPRTIWLPRTGPAYPDPDYSDWSGRRADDTDRLDDLPAQLAAAATRAQHLDDQRTYYQLSPEALEPCDQCGRVGLHTFREFAAEQAEFMARAITESAVFAGMHGLSTAWAGDYSIPDAA